MDTVENSSLNVPNFGDVKFYGVRNQPDQIIVELMLGDGVVLRFIISAESLKQLGTHFYAQAKQHLGEPIIGEPRPSLN